MPKSWAVATLAAVSLASAAARAERPRIAVMEVTAPKASADVRERVTRSVQEGLLAAGADVVEGMPAAATGPGGAPCEGNGCVTAVAKATLSSYVVRGTLEVVGRTYELRLEMLDGKAGALLDSREDRCEICTEGEALEMAGVSASTLKAQVFKKKSAASAEPSLAAGAAARLAAPAALRAAPPPAEVEPARRHRRWGWAGVAAGVVAGALGAELIAVHGHGTCDDGAGVQCESRYTTRPGGIALVTGGVLAIAAGVLVLAGRF